MDKEMRRLDACIDACAGISTEALEGGAIRELMEAAREITSKNPNGTMSGSPELLRIELLRALTKVEAPDG